LKFLLDTHVLLWALGDPDRLRAETHRTLAEAGNEVFVSLISLWEIVVKVRVGKLKADIASVTAQMAPASKIQLLGVSPRHLYALNGLPFHERHRDPFDQLIIAQAISDGMTLVTSDRNAGLYQVLTLAA
jgi:PIN domain nuclease of toxin-antitoxin system